MCYSESTLKHSVESKNEQHWKNFLSRQFVRGTESLPHLPVCHRYEAVHLVEAALGWDTEPAV